MTCLTQKFLKKQHVSCRTTCLQTLKWTLLHIHDIEMLNLKEI